MSRVVNGSLKVSERTRRKVLSVIEDAGYTPNAFARGLGFGSMRTVGIICPDISDAYIAKAVSYLEKGLYEKGYQCILGCSGYEQRDKENYTNFLLSKKVDMLIMVGSTYSGNEKNYKETEYIRKAAKHVPTFMINARVDGDNVYCVYLDDFGAAYEVTSSLIKSGRKRILFLHNSRSFSAMQKLEGYETALKDAGYPVLGDLKFYTKNEIHYTRDLLLQHKDLKFDAVLATDDELAVAVLKYAKAKRLSVPGDLSVVGYNNSNLSECSEPELTSVDSRLEDLCNITIERMFEMIGGNMRSERNTKVAYKIVKRSTTDF